MMRSVINERVWYEEEMKVSSNNFLSDYYEDIDMYCEKILIDIDMYITEEQGSESRSPGGEGDTQSSSARRTVQTSDKTERG
jgi:hypothetical protein